MMLNLESLLDKAGLGTMIGRDASSLREREWQAVDDEVVEVVRPILRAREVLAPLFDRSLTGAGWMEVLTEKMGDRAPAKRDVDGEPETADIPEVSDFASKSIVIHAEGFLKWRMLESSRNGRRPFSTTVPASNAQVVGQSEEELYWAGDADLGLDGVLRPTGYSTAAGSSWAAGAGAGQVNVFEDLNAMSSYLDGENAANLTYSGPRLLVLNPAQARRARSRYQDGGGRNPLQEARDSDFFQQVVVTPWQTAGRATLIPLNRAYMKIYPMVDVTTEQLPATNRNVHLSTFEITSGVIARVQGAVVERTGLT